MINPGVIVLIILATIYALAPANIVPKPDVSQYLYISPCEKPIGYKVGSIDSRFDITPDNLLKSANEAAKIINSGYDKTIFVYDPLSRLSLNLIYDQRQLLTSEIGKMEGNLKNQRGTLEDQAAQFDQDAAKFKTDLADLNGRIAYWNSQGGAPPDEYDKLVSEQLRLKAEADRLNNIAAGLNRTSEQFNLGVGQLNQTIREFNRQVSQRPELGQYSGSDDTITIYFYANEKELIHTLAHEFGHALGLGHSENPGDLMYAYTTDTTRLGQQDITAIREACRKKGVWEIFVMRLERSINYLRSPEFKSRLMQLLEAIH